MEPLREGLLEADELYFGPQRVRSRCGRGAGGKTIVFCLLKRGDKVYTGIVPNAFKADLKAVFRGRANINLIVRTDGWAAYHGLVDLGCDKHLRVEHMENIFAQQLNHINGIESFWSLTKRRLSRFCGVPTRTFYLHLKETEFRFNHRHENLYKQLLNRLRKEALGVLCLLTLPLLFHLPDLLYPDTFGLPISELDIYLVVGFEHFPIFAHPLIDTVSIRRARSDSWQSASTIVLRE